VNAMKLSFKMSILCIGPRFLFEGRDPLSRPSVGFIASIVLSKMPTKCWCSARKYRTDVKVFMSLHVLRKSLCIMRKHYHNNFWNYWIFSALSSTTVPANIVSMEFGN